MRIIFLGAPGAGKGTQAEIVSKTFDIPAISTGNILRAAMKSGSELGVKAKQFVEKGLLVPDKLIIDMVKERLVEPDCTKGFILDGFPRTIPQAIAFDEMGIAIDKVIELDVSDEEIVQRMSGRRICRVCGASYHIEYKKPSQEGICDDCGGELYVRSDDAPETVLERLKVYHAETEPLKDYYAAKGLLRIVKGQENVQDTTALTLKTVEEA